MILQIDITGSQWIVGLGLAFGLALIMSYLTYKDLPSFLVYFTIMIGFGVYSNLLELWILVLSLLITTINMIYEYKKRGVGF